MDRKNHQKYYTLDQLSKFIAHELDKLDQCPSFSTWYLSIQFHLCFPTNEHFEESCRFYRKFRGEEAVKRMETRREEIMRACGFSWEYSYGLGKEKDKYTLHHEYRVDDPKYLIIIREEDTDKEDVIKRSKIIPNLEKHLGTTKFSSKIQKELSKLLSKAFENRYITFSWDKSSSGMEFSFPINKRSPEIIQREAREYVKQNEIKRKILNDPQAMIQFYESTQA